MSFFLSRERPKPYMSTSGVTGDSGLSLWQSPGNKYVGLMIRIKGKCAINVDLTPDEACQLASALLASAGKPPQVAPV